MSHNASDKTIQFRSRSRRAGFTQMDNPVLRSKRLSAPSKIVWGLLCYYARQDESCWPGQDLLAEEVPCSQRALRDYLAELAAVGLVEVQRRGLGLTNVYWLNDLDSLGSATAAAPDRQEMPPGSADSAGQERLIPPVPVETKTQETKTQGRTDSLPLAIDDGRQCPAAVDRRKVTAMECERAWAIMDAFNAAAGTKARAKGYVEKIIRRCRENPELETADHVRVIQAVFAGHHWWTGRPDPAIIYGSDTQFDRCLANTPSGPSGASVQSVGVQTPPEDDLDQLVRW